MPPALTYRCSRLVALVHVRLLHWGCVFHPSRCTACNETRCRQRQRAPLTSTSTARVAVVVSKHLSCRRAPVSRVLSPKPISEHCKSPAGLRSDAANYVSMPRAKPSNLAEGADLWTSRQLALMRWPRSSTGSFRCQGRCQDRAWVTLLRLGVPAPFLQHGGPNEPRTGPTAHWVSYRTRRSAMVNHIMDLPVGRRWRLGDGGVRAGP